MKTFGTALVLSTSIALPVFAQTETNTPNTPPPSNDTPSPSYADALNKGHKYVSLIFENDIFFQEDGGYTNGIGVAWGNGLFDKFDSSNTPWPIYKLVENLSFNTRESRHKAISYFIGQGMITPEDITKEVPEDGDAPYAGLLAARVTLHSFDAITTDRLALSLGIVGPSSGAEDSQKLVHKITGSENPKGWDSQLKDEAVFRVEFSRSNRLWDTVFDNGLEMDMVDTKRAGAGNLVSDLGYGLSFRFGQKLRDSFPTATEMPGREINPIAGDNVQHWLFFVNVFGSYVFNNLLIEGNSDNPNVGADLVHEQASLAFGAAYNVGRWAFAYTGSVSTKAYEGQEDPGKFGSINVTYKLQ